jgi:hypothetical protein
VGSLSPSILALARIFGKYGVIIGRVAVFIQTGKVYCYTHGVDVDLFAHDIENILKKIAKELAREGFELKNFDIKRIVEKLKNGNVVKIEVGDHEVDLAVRDDKYVMVEFENEKIMVKDLFELLNDRLEILGSKLEETYALDIIAILEELDRRGRGGDSLKHIIEHRNARYFLEALDRCVNSWGSVSVKVPPEVRDELLMKAIKLRQYLKRYI